MFKKILNTFGTKMLAAALNFVIAIIISQTLGDTGSGTQSLVTATITFILIFSEIVCGASIIYLAPRHSFKKILVASVVWSALIAVIMGFSIRLFYPKLEPDLVVHVAILSFISSLSNINFRFLVGKEEIQKANYNTLLQPVLLTITLAVYYIALKKSDIYGYIIGLYAAYGGTFLLGVWMLREEYANLPNDKDKNYKSALKDLFKYGFLNQTGHFVQFDAVLAMYHDQGLIPFKTLDMTGVNYTAGLNIVRTSPDHGTGYDIAGKNQADERSMRNALFMAIDVLRKRAEYDELRADPLPFIERPDTEGKPRREFIDFKTTRYQENKD